MKNEKYQKKYLMLFQHLDNISYLRLFSIDKKIDYGIL